MDKVKELLIYRRNPNGKKHGKGSHIQDEYK